MYHRANQDSPAFAHYLFDAKRLKPVCFWQNRKGPMILVKLPNRELARADRGGLIDFIGDWDRVDRITG